ncbi:hypothetical protein [uncultured Clostridium sp.]|uniref:hypothetical protein n=1 Tax=uncultured Clostridium sp. TaxID=59620 RepID=UPI0028E63187|nr:hypothetical protein [uncultured Clostridium sp.]
MEKGVYEKDEDYILDALEEKILEELCKYMPREMNYNFSMFLAIRSTIEKIYKNKITNK